MTTLTMAVLWIVLGLIAGYIASMVVSKRGAGAPTDILLGIVGAVLGGWIFNAAGVAGVTGFNVWSLFVATAGAILVLVVWHAIPHSVSHA